MNLGNPFLFVSQLEFGAFIQTDINLSDRLLVSPGLRYQIQNHLRDYNNFDPRMSLSYQINKSTILRLGPGFFDDTITVSKTIPLLKSKAFVPDGARGDGESGGRSGRGRRSSRGDNPRATTTATPYIYIQNAFNHRNFNNPSGVMTSPFFGQSTTAQAPRMVELGVRFNF